MPKPAKFQKGRRKSNAEYNQELKNLNKKTLKKPLSDAVKKTLLKKSEEEIEGSNKKITSLSKEISGLKVALNDSQELMKSLQKMHEEKIKKMESEKFQIRGLLEKELADKQKITNNLETSKSQLKELTIEVEGLKKRIIELQEDQSPNQ